MLHTLVVIFTNLQIVVDEAHIAALDLRDDVPVAGVGFPLLLRHVRQLLLQALDLQVLRAAPPLQLLYAWHGSGRGV